MGARLSGIRDILGVFVAFLVYPFHVVYKVGRAIFYDGLYKKSWEVSGRNLAGGLTEAFFSPIYYLYRGIKGFYKLGSGNYPSWEIGYEERMYGVKLT